MSSRQTQKQLARDRRLAREAELKAAARRRRRVAALTVTLLAIALPGGAVLLTETGANNTPATASLPSGSLVSLATLGHLRPAGPPGITGPEGVPIPHAPPLADGASRRGGSSVDAIHCEGAEQVLFHIHAHLSVFVNGAARRIPSGIGIPGAQISRTPAGPYVAAGSCFYWLHTHAADGIIHIESPVARTYTLGNFFDVWGQRLGRDAVGPVDGPVTALYDGRLFRGNPRAIPLTKHAQIQLDVGRALVAPVQIKFPAGL
jgi:hypothetical protein